MPRYHVTITRTQTRIATAATEIDIPSDDEIFVRRYVELMMHPDMKYSANGINPSFYDSGAPEEATKVSVSPTSLCRVPRPQRQAVERLPLLAPRRRQAPDRPP